MKRYVLDIILLCMQFLMFYIFPLFAGPTDAMGMVFILLFTTLLLSLLMALFSNKWIKFLYPVVTAVIFLPTVYLYYNESAFVHAIWYFIISIIGFILGLLIRKPFIKKQS